MQTINYLAVRLPLADIGGTMWELSESQMFAEFDEAFECIETMVSEDWGYYPGIEDHRPKSPQPITLDTGDFRYQIWVVKMPL